jgi:hypothetical protein
LVDVIAKLGGGLASAFVVVEPGRAVSFALAVKFRTSKTSTRCVASSGT